MPRERLPNRRPNYSYEFTHNGVNYIGCVSFYRDGRPYEVFIDGGKIGSAVSLMALSAGITASLAFQHGVLLKDLRAALPKLPDNSPADPLGVFLKMVEQEIKRHAAAQESDMVRPL